MRKYVVPALSGLLAGYMLYFPEEAAKAAVEACRLWAFAVMPGLFPFMVCMLLITGSMGARLSGGISRFWGLPRPFLPLLAMGLLSGSPGGARLSQELALPDSPEKKAALKRFALYAGTMSPMFFVGTLGTWLGSNPLGWTMLFAHWLGAFFTGQLSRLFFPSREVSTVQAANTAKPELARVLNSAASAMLAVCGLMMLGSVAAQMIKCALPGLPEPLLAGLQALMEVTAGCSRLLTLALPGVPGLLPSLMCAATSFGGMSILLQNYAFFQAGGVSLPYLIKGRLCHAALSFAICLGLCNIAAPAAAPVYAPPAHITGGIPVALLGIWWLSLLLPPCKIFRKKKHA